MSVRVCECMHARILLGGGGPKDPFSLNYAAATYYGNTLKTCAPSIFWGEAQFSTLEFIT